MKIYYSLLFLLFHLTVGAQLYISEYSASNLDTHLDSFESAEDWIQITNGGNTIVDVNGWYLSDKENNPTKWSFSINQMLAPNESIMVLCSGRPGVEDEIHASFKLSQTEGKDKLILADPDGTIIDNISMQTTLKDHSRYRENANSDEWFVCTNPDPTIVGCYDNNKYQYTAQPTILHIPGYHDSTIVVSIENNEPNSELKYTVDGTKVTSTSPIYTSPISIHNTTIVKARAFSTDNEILPGKMDFATFFINETFSLPIFSIAGNNLIQLANGDGALEPIASVEYFTPDGVRQSTSYGELNRHGKGSWANDQRSLDYICRDEMGYSKAIKGELFKTRKRDEFQRLMFRASGDDNYPTSSGSSSGSAHLRDEYVQSLAYENGLELDCRTVQRAILFLNGQYWGVYGLREKVADNDYTKEYYDQGKYEIEFITHWGGPTVRYGENSLQSWTELRDFILSQDMSVEANYERVDNELNLTSLIDYFAANTNTVSTDWLDWNTGWWRGLNPDGKHKKWGYILWDMDATFGYFINWIGLPNTNPDALPCDIDDLSLSLSWGEHEDILYKLIEENDHFRNMYFSRYADIANSAFSCETMIETLNRLESDIDPEMPRQMERWEGSGSYNEWKSNVDELRAYVEERCEFIHESLVECHEELTDIYDITLMTEPDGIGEIDFSTLDIETFPWQGKYYGGMVYDIKAKVFDEYDSDYVFSHWESESGNIILPDASSRKASYAVNQSDVLVAVFTIKTSTDEEAIGQKWAVYPNPTTGQLSINYTISQSSDVELYVTNTVGQQVAILQPNIRNTSGDHQITTTLPDMIPNGLYFLQLKIDNRLNSKMVSKI